MIGQLLVSIDIHNPQPALLHPCALRASLLLHMAANDENYAYKFPI